MSRYIDANKLIERLRHNPDFLTAPKHSKDGIIDEIVYQPTADVVEVVRCKDCKYCFHYGRPNYERYECEYYGTSDEVVDYVEPMHYCSYGKRIDQIAKEMIDNG